MDNKPTKKPFNYNYISVIVIYVWAAAFLYKIPSISEKESRMFPLFISIFAIVLATLLLLKTYFKWGKKEETFDFSGTLSALFMALILLTYIIATTYIGFYFATPIYLCVSMWVLGQRNKKLILLISVSTPLIVYLFFDLLLGLRIPEGMLF